MNIHPVEIASVFTLGNEMAHEAAQRESLLDRAMGAGRKRKSSEKLRRGRLPAEGLALAARDADGRVIGTVRLWNVAVHRRSGGQAQALLLGPLAVDPFFKGQGIGSALMNHAIAEAARLEHSAIILVGDFAYYRRFGFMTDKTADLAMPGPFEKPRLLALELQEGALDDAHGVIFAAGRKAVATIPRERRVA